MHESREEQLLAILDAWHEVCGEGLRLMDRGEILAAAQCLDVASLLNTYYVIVTNIDMMAMLSFTSPN